MNVPFFRPEIGRDEENEVLAVLRSGWLTSGPRVRRFEEAFAAAVGARHSVAVNSATAALHLAVEALGLSGRSRRQAVLVPTMTFAATAEVVRYMDAVPILVDCAADTLNLDFDDAERKIAKATRGELAGIGPVQVTGIIPVHVGGSMVDLDRLREFSEAHKLWVVEDAAHAFPAAWRRSATDPWIHCGDNTAAISCFSFYANKTITTGEGGMAVTADPTLAARMRLMSLHGLSRDAWNRYSASGSWDYQIVAPGFKYNLTDIAAAIGIHQLARAESMHQARESLARAYREQLGRIDEIDVPSWPENRLHSWHLFPIRLKLDQLAIDRGVFMDALQKAGVSCSVHWRPLHLHPYYQQHYGCEPGDLPVATREWQRLISLPLFPSMTLEEHAHVVRTVAGLCATHARRS
jgi:dTDP-4-amino-4,6-dideoxygalactose transaminase